MSQYSIFLMEQMKFNYKLSLLIITLFAAFVRLVFLDQFPNGFTGDEAQQGYSAYSILKTGKDEWGEILPIFPRGFGDYKPPLYTYLTVPSVGLLGLTVEAVRLPAAVIGILSVLVVFFLAKELLKDERIALWSSILFAINPWHIQLSRTAFEGGVGILTFSIGLLFYLKSGIRNLILSSIFFSLTLYSYHSWRLFIVLFIAGLILSSWKKLISIKYWIPGLILLIFILPLMININSVLKRSSDVGVFSKDRITGYFSNKGTSSLYPIVDRLLDNKFVYILNEFSGNYLSYFSPGFIFGDDRSDNTYLNFPYSPLLYFIELIFWLFAIYSLITKRLENRKIIILWFILAAVPASLAVGSMNANRTPTLLPLASVISAIGAVYMIEKWKYANKIISVSLLISFVFFLHFYFLKLPQKPPDNLRYGYDQVFKKILEVESQYDQVVTSKAFTEPQIFIAFYSKMDPVEFQMASTDWLRYEKSDKLYVDQLQSWNLGKFYFEDLNWNLKDSNRENALIVGKPEDFPQDVESILDVYDHKKKMLYRLIPVNYEKN